MESAEPPCGIHKRKEVSLDKALIVAVNLVRVGIAAECSQEEIAQGIIVLFAPD